MNRFFNLIRSYHKRYAEEKMLEIFDDIIDINYIDDDETILSLAIQKNMKELVDIILKNKNLDINLTNSFGFTPLMLSIECESEDISLKILDIPDVNINLQDLASGTALSYAVYNKMDNVVNKIINILEENILIKENSYETVALEHAINNPNNDIAMKILELSNINLKRNSLALIKAIRNDHPIVALSLLQLDSVNINIQDQENNTALVWSIRKGYLEIAKEILKLPNKNINILNNEGKSALIYAVKSSYINTILFLLNQEDINIDYLLNTKIKYTKDQNGVQFIKDIFTYYIEESGIHDFSHVERRVKEIQTTRYLPWRIERHYMYSSFTRIKIVEITLLRSKRKTILSKLPEELIEEVYTYL